MNDPCEMLLDFKAAAIFIFVSHPREGRFLANFQEKTNKIWK